MIESLLSRRASARRRLSCRGCNRCSQTPASDLSGLVSGICSPLSRFRFAADCLPQTLPSCSKSAGSDWRRASQLRIILYSQCLASRKRSTAFPGSTRDESSVLPHGAFLCLLRCLVFLPELRQRLPRVLCCLFLFVSVGVACSRLRSAARTPHKRRVFSSCIF